ncbi:MAG: tripartite tricarboxylate transporter substrate binding protein [Comamonadaceae bacterium]|nr:MAG: tripartite tricarboxylate transporter substrate binding protein [Comamonadaceae bacterium]
MHSPSPRRRRLLRGLALGAAIGAAAWPALAQQGAYPDRPVRIIVGFPAGTGPDIVARLLAQMLSQAWGNQGVIVDNKPGAGGLIAAGEAARAAPDGYTLMLGETGQLSIAPNSYNRLPYDPKNDFVPVSQVVSSDFVLLVNPQKVPATSLREFVDWSRQQKGLFMATFGAGTPGHFGAYMFGEAIGQKPEPVHYKNTADALSGLYGGDVSGVFATVGLAASTVKSGRLVALGSTGETRSPSLPEVPTIKEQGYPGLAFSAWFGIVAPSRTPPAVVARLNADIVRLVQSAEGRQKFLEAGFRATGTGREEFARVIAADTLSWGKAVAATGFKAD